MCMYVYMLILTVDRYVYIYIYICVVRILVRSHMHPYGMRPALFCSHTNTQDLKLHKVGWLAPN